jgi:hypothetical protein
VAIFSFLTVVIFALSFLIWSRYGLKVSTGFIVSALSFFLISIAFVWTVYPAHQTAVVSTILVAPIAEEAARFALLRFTKQPRLYVGAWVAAVCIALIESNNLLRLRQSANAGDLAFDGFSSEDYFVFAFPSHFVIDVLGHGLFGTIMAFFILKRRYLLAFFVPLVVHVTLNAQILL